MLSSATLINCARILLTYTLYILIGFHVMEKYFSMRYQKWLSRILYTSIMLAVSVSAQNITNYFFYESLRQASTIFLMHFLFFGTAWSKAANACILAACQNIIWNLAGSLLSIGLLIYTKNTSTADTFSSAYESLQLKTELLTDCITYAVTGIGIYLIFLRKKLLVHIIKDTGNYVLFFVTGGLLLLYNLIGYGITHSIMVTSNTNYSDIWLDMILTHTEIMIASVLCLSIILVLYFGIQHFMYQNIAVKQQTEKIHYYQNLLKERDSQTKLRHDFKNHLIAMKQYTENEDWNALKQYMDNVFDFGMFTDSDLATGNRILDALLGIKKEKMQAEGIEFFFDVYFQRKLKINDFDLCILFGNLLDNAIEAAGQNPKKYHVCCRTEILKKNLLIEIENEFCTDGKTIFSEQNYNTGLWNVETVVRKYNGVLDISTENQVFSVSILLPDVYPAIHDTD